MLPRILYNPKLPANCKKWNAVVPFGKNWELNVSIEKINSVYECEVLWDAKDCKTTSELLINDTKLVPNKTCKLSIKCEETSKKKNFDKFEVQLISKLLF